VGRLRSLQAAPGGPLTLDLTTVVPKALDLALGEWVPELERYARAVVHSKLVVVDPRSDHSVVIAGAHNFGQWASRCNDENMVIVEGNRRLATAYAAHIAGLYRHYRLRYLLHLRQRFPRAAPALEQLIARRTDDSWQDAAFAAGSPQQRELECWLGPPP
jgi:phosphatidylserine/phosphatidylglycerophosphate/cardiolipin synthase-like enzyme